MPSYFNPPSFSFANLKQQDKHGRLMVSNNSQVTFRERR